MIVKFDHIARGCTKDSLNSVIAFFEDYSIVFAEYNIPNGSNKFSLMSSRQNDHDIVLLDAEGTVPIELTAYDSVVEGDAKYYIDEPDGIIGVNTQNLLDSFSFYSAIGFKEISECELKMGFPMGVKSITLRLNQLESGTFCRDNKLDSDGFCCLAFVSNNIEKEKDKLELNGIATTAIQKIQLHGREMRVFFASSKHGDICEFIGMR